MANEIYIDPWPVNLVIMAGGKGTRLKSVTLNTHKSLVEVANKPVIRHLVDHMCSSGFRNIHLSVGHFATQISDYLGSGHQLGVSIEYITETQPMGSIGALTLKKNWQYDHFLVINGDVFTNFDITEFISAYFSKQADMGILTSEEDFEIPFGVFHVEPTGNITQFVEKPKLAFQISTGIYMFNKKILNLIPESTRFEGWELVASALNSGFKTISIPIRNGFWIDIGTAETLHRAQEMAKPSIAG
jgi:NDP-sugar pyrophosphorylase family protein